MQDPILTQRLHRHAWAIVHDHAQAEDAVQQTFSKLLRVLRHAPQRDLSRTVMQAWLFTSLRRHSIDLLRTRRRMDKLRADLSSVQDSQAAAPWALDHLALAKMRSAWQRLPQEDQQQLREAVDGDLRNSSEPSACSRRQRHAARCTFRRLLLLEDLIPLHHGARACWGLTSALLSATPATASGIPQGAELERQTYVCLIRYSSQLGCTDPSRILTLARMVPALRWVLGVHRPAAALLRRYMLDGALALGGLATDGSHD